MHRQTGDREPTLSELEFAKLGVSQYPMPSLVICARIAEDVYHDRPTTVHWHRPIRVPEQDVYCAGTSSPAAPTRATTASVSSPSAVRARWKTGRVPTSRSFAARFPSGSSVARWPSSPRPTVRSSAPAAVATSCRPLARRRTRGRRLRGRHLGAGSGRDVQRAGPRAVRGCVGGRAASTSAVRTRRTC